MSLAVPTSRSARAIPRVAPAAVVSLALLAVVGAAALDLANRPADRAAAYAGWGAPWSLLGLGLAVAGAAVLWRHPRHVIGRVLAASGLVWALDGLAESYRTFGQAADPDRPLTGAALWFVAQFGSVLLLTLPAVLVLYPTGRRLPGRWGTAGLVVLVMAAALPVGLLLAPAELMYADPPVPVETGFPELGVPVPAYQAGLRVAQLVTFASVLAAVGVFVVRARRAEGLERVQVRWLAWAAVVCVVLGLTMVLFRTALVSEVALVVALVVTAGSVTVGLLAPRVLDVDQLLVSTVVYGAVACAVVALDLVLVAALGQVVGDRLAERDVAVLVLLLAVAVYGPLRGWLGGLVRRRIVGRRADRYGVVSELAARLERSDDVAHQLPALAEAVAAAFGLGFVRVEVYDVGGTLSATHGEPPEATRTTPITYGGEPVGRLVLPARGLRSLLSGRDHALLLDVVRQAAVAIRSARLAADLQLSRERLVLDREEDRRRIRRDLHDGLGPVLGGVAMRLDAVGNALESDPALARTMLATSRHDITEALADVRRLVHGLRPPALDDLGLLDAVRQQVERLGSADLEVRLRADPLPPLPAAVEVAAYRIVSEALTNVVRHAHAGRAEVALGGRPGELLVEVSDDGRGIAADVTAGVGLGSLRDRAAELGGRTEIVCPPDGGTRVRAWLPYDVPEDADG